MRRAYLLQRRFHGCIRLCVECLRSCRQLNRRGVYLRGTPSKLQPRPPAPIIASAFRACCHKLPTGSQPAVRALGGLLARASKPRPDLRKLAHSSPTGCTFLIASHSLWHPERMQCQHGSHLLRAGFRRSGEPAMHKSICRSCRAYGGNAWRERATGSGPASTSIAGGSTFCLACR